MILKITKMSDYDFAIFIYDECEKCEMPKNPYHDKHGCPKEVEEECAKCDGGGTDFCDCNESEDDCCKTCEQTDIEICYDCGECADPSLPNRCCECGEKEEEDLDICCIGCNERMCSFNESEENKQKTSILPARIKLN